jgi:hypothetical protein
MSKVASDISNLGGDLFGETASYIKNNWENIYVFVWAITITIIIINVLGLDMSKGDGKKPIFKNIAIYEQFSNVCKDADKNCPKRTGRKSCTAHECCVWATSKNESKCLQGDKDGPEIDNDKKGSKWDEYWFLKKRYNL